MAALTAGLLLVQGRRLGCRPRLCTRRAAATGCTSDGSSPQKKADKDGRSLTRAEVQAVADALRRDHTSRVLDLGGRDLGGPGADLVLAALAANSSLQHLRLAGNWITDEGAEGWSAALKANATLLRLDLRCNTIRSKGARALAAALRAGCPLRFLTLADNFIEDDGAYCLLHAILANPHLKVLDLRGNRLSPEAQRTLIRELEGSGTLLYLGVGDITAPMHDLAASRSPPPPSPVALEPPKTNPIPGTLLETPPNSPMACTEAEEGAHGGLVVLGLTATVLLIVLAGACNDTPEAAPMLERTPCSEISSVDRLGRAWFALWRVRHGPDHPTPWVTIPCHACPTTPTDPELSPSTRIRPTSSVTLPTPSQSEPSPSIRRLSTNSDSVTIPCHACPATPTDPELSPSTRTHPTSSGQTQPFQLSPKLQPGSPQTWGIISLPDSDEVRSVVNDSNNSASSASFTWPPPQPGE